MEPVFTPEQLENSNEFVIYKDLIRVLTKKGEVYTKAQLKEMIEETIGKVVD